MAENDEERLQSELERLRERLSQARQGRHGPAPAPEPAGEKPRGDSGLALGMRAASEFIGAVVVGAAIGWGLDWLLRTKPLFLILFFLIGVAAGVWNVIRATAPKGGPKRGD